MYASTPVHGFPQTDYIFCDDRVERARCMRAIRIRPGRSVNRCRKNYTIAMIVF